MPQRGQMVQRGQGKWLLRIYRGEVSGKKKYASKMFSGTTAQARQALTQMLREDDTDTFVPASKLLLTDYLTRWLEGKIDVSENTRTSYENMLKHAKTHLGHHRVTDLETLAVQQFVAKLIADDLSPRSVRYVVRVLRSALEDAVQDGILQRNPVKRVRLPQQVKRAPSVLSIEQMNALLAKTASDPTGPLWALLLTTGMRPQEAFGLKWTDIDFENSAVSISRTLVSDGKGKTRLSDTVKADSRRSVNISASTLAALKAHKKAQAAEILEGGTTYERLGLVFTNQYGRPLDISRVRRWWKAALDKTKIEGKSLPAIRLYDTRHSHATALLANGEGLAAIADRLGHSDVSVTAKHYAHVLPESRKKMGEFVERMMSGKA
jgi:integrase